MDITCYAYDNGTLDKLGVVDDFSNGSFTRSYSNIGEWQLILDGNSLNARRVKGTQIISLSDGVAGLVTNYSEAINNGQHTITYTGIELKGIATLRQIYPATGEAYQSYSNVSPEYVIAQLIIKQIINPEDTVIDGTAVSGADRAIAGTLAAFDEGAELINFNGRFDNVADAIQTIANLYSIGWYADIQDGAIVWHIYRGIDRRKSKGINSRMIVSYSLDSFGDSQVNNTALIPNVALVAGQGEGVDRAISLVGAGTGLLRSEVYIDARDLEDAEALPIRGLQKLTEYGDALTYEATFSQQFISMYKQPYDLGDIGTIEDSRLPEGEVDFILTEVTEVYEADNLRLDATFGYDRQSLAAAIKRTTGNTQALISAEGGGGGTVDLSEIEAAITTKQDKVTGVTDAEIGYLVNVTSDIQEQIDNKSNTEHTHSYLPLTAGADFKLLNDLHIDTTVINQQADLIINTPTSSTINFQRNGVNRWLFAKNTADNFYLSRYDTGGTVIDQPIYVDYATGTLRTQGNDVWHKGNASISGDILFNGNATSGTLTTDAGLYKFLGVTIARASSTSTKALFVIPMAMLSGTTSYHHFFNGTTTYWVRLSLGSGTLSVNAVGTDSSLTNVRGYN